MEQFLSSQIAQQTWELENNIVSMLSPAPKPDSASDEIFFYDSSAQTKFQQEKPWSSDPHFFKRVKISALALLKMVVHARSGGTIEVMGLMQGKTDGDAIIVMDAFALPVEGTETRVNAQADAYEYMVDYSQTNKQAGRLENVVGWYHSHPGYGCWLSGIDVSTQMLNQQFQEPFLAVVIDPTRTVSAGKVEIGAFRTYPEGYKPLDELVSEYQTIPLNKIEDFGVHCKQYYALDITYFKSSLDNHLLDLLWNKYWVNTLSSSPLLGNGDYVAGQISDLGTSIVRLLIPTNFNMEFYVQNVHCEAIVVCGDEVCRGNHQETPDKWHIEECMIGGPSEGCMVAYASKQMKSAASRSYVYSTLLPLSG
ncbi:hypothetical protein G4B88_009400 [Cannabis sativa]|uniref:MPN domain-containing protein n=1 Tax=Cannabis sativa TaxID=3483 RepID=A0A7J6E635_CANSA|nr:hypothetical protein G4B88_009400 [Cannabis sativa]